MLPATEVDVHLALGILLLHTSFSQARTLTVDQTIALALDNSRSIAAAEAGADKARAEEKKALFAMFPKVSATGMYRYQDPLPEMTWDITSLMGSGSSTEAACSEVPWGLLGLPTDLTAGQYNALCEWYVMMNSYTAAATEPVTMVLGVRDNYTVQLAVDQVLFAGTALRQVHKASADMVQASEAQIRQARAEAAYSAEQAFYGLYLAREAVRVIEEAQGTMDAYVFDLDNLVKVGIGANSDLLSAQAQQSRTRLDSLKARRGVQVAEMAFRASLGIPEGESVELILGEPRAPDLPLDRESLLALARSKRPEMQALDATLGALDHYAKASWSSWVPTIALNGTYLGQNPNPYTMMLNPEGSAEWFWSTNVTLVATWNLWDQGAALFGHKAAVASLRQLKQQRGLLNDMLPVEIESALGSYEEGIQAVELARVGLSQAEEAFRLEKNRFQNGMSNNTQMLLAQSTFSGARLSLLQAETTLRTSHAALRKAVGLDPERQP